MGAKDPSNINAGEVGSTPSDTLNNVCSEETKDRFQNFFVLAVYSSAPPPPKKNFYFFTVANKLKLGMHVHTQMSIPFQMV